MTVPETGQLVGRTIGKYQVVERLGRGGMAVVYKAYQGGLDRYVALKLLHGYLADEPDFLERFKREARAMGALKHPSIAAVYDFDVVGDTYYLVMEYIGGGSLRDELETASGEEGWLPLARAVRIGLEVSDALAYAHQRAMVHRDIKPGNILLRPDGSAVITDFGIARMVGGSQHTLTGTMLGTPAYMAPEQGLGQPGDGRADVYAVGILLYRMVTGRLPFDAASPLAVVMMQVNDPLPSPRLFAPHLPPALEAIIVRAAAKDPKDRFRTADDLADALRVAASLPELDVATTLPPPLLHRAATPDSPDTRLVRTRSDQERHLRPTVSPLGSVLAPSDETVMRLPDEAHLAQAKPADAEGLRTLRRGRSWRPTRRQSWLVASLALPLLLLWGLLTARSDRSASIAGSSDTDSQAPAATAAMVEPVGGTTGRVGRAAPLAPAAASPTTTPTAAPTAAPTAPPTPEPAPAEATKTRVPLPPATPTPACEPDARLVAYGVTAPDGAHVATVDAAFALAVRLENNGSCPWHPAWRLTGNDLMPHTINRWIEPGASLVVTMAVPAATTPGELPLVWQLRDARGQPIGKALSTPIEILPPPATPTARAVPTATPLPTPARQIGFALAFNWCEFAGIDWRCELVLTPFGGVGPPYTFWVFDSEPPARYFGEGPQYHIVRGRRCFAWINEIKLQDDAGNATSRTLFFDPTTDALMSPLFPGGTCTVD